MAPYDDLDPAFRDTFSFLISYQNDATFRKGLKCTDKSGAPVHYDYGEKIDLAVFPGLQGGPHNHAIAGVAVAMGLAATDEFRDEATRSILIEEIYCTFEHMII